MIRQSVHTFLQRPGVLTAANWDARTEPLKERLDAIIQTAGGKPIAWKLPAVLSLPLPPEITEHQLAEAWRYGFERQWHRAAPLVVDTPSLVQMTRRSLASAVTQVSRLLAAPTIERRSSMKQAGDIASVAFASSREVYGHDWSWPLRLGLSPRRARAKIDPLEDVTAIKRGFLVLDAQSEAPDVFVVAEPNLQAISALKDRPLGIALVRASSTARTPRRNQLLQQWLSAESLAPAAFFDVRPEFTGKFLDTLTYELSHDEPLDVAVFEAYARAWQREQEGGNQTDIILFAPKEPGDVFEDSRITNRVNELSRRLDRLPESAIIEVMGDASALGVTLGRHTVRDVQDDLRQAYEANRLDFSRESSGASALKSLDEGVSRLEAAGPEANRFTDVALYEGGLFSGDDLNEAIKIDDAAPLVAGRHYTLEVAVRLRRTGIASEQAPVRPVFNPRTDREDLTVYLRVRSACPEIRFVHAFLSVTWPYNADSDSAFFRFRTDELDRGTIKEGTTEVHLYHSSLDLLDTVEISITLVSDDLAAHVPPKRRTLAWPGEIPAEPRVELKSPERLASITVSHVDGGYQFDFKFRDRSKNEIVIPAVRNITNEDLKQPLEGVRDFWTRLVISNYSEKPYGHSPYV